MSLPSDSNDPFTPRRLPLSPSKNTRSNTQHEHQHTPTPISFTYQPVPASTERENTAPVSVERSPKRQKITHAFGGVNVGTRTYEGPPAFFYEPTPREPRKPSHAYKLNVQTSTPPHIPNSPVFPQTPTAFNSFYSNFPSSPSTQATSRSPKSRRGRPKQKSSTLAGPAAPTPASPPAVEEQLEVLLFQFFQIRTLSVQIHPACLECLRQLLC
ncbi:hypothetical protein D9758_004145 [Tetrapyrgos nigripes]|uniref:Uncharacterized protein n=1 Tax=Tetrapyrgos nigripes TaxID=182062 RepID=A0A8H5GU47_9AGAR|nr:hypothetical protein D9758_004145 [Tetrapyrgos nigripes]